MDFGRDPYPKWTEKEEMTLIFLAAFQTWGAAEIRGELNALFGNERSLEACSDRMKKNERAIAALRDLVVSNPVTIAKYWKRMGVVDANVTEPDEPLLVCGADSIREMFTSNNKNVSLFTQLRMCFPDLNGDVTEDMLVEAVRKLQMKKSEPPVRVTRITAKSVEFDDELSLPQIRDVLQVINEASE